MSRGKKIGNNSQAAKNTLLRGKIKPEKSLQDLDLPEYKTKEQLAQEAVEAFSKMCKDLTKPALLLSKIKLGATVYNEYMEEIREAGVPVEYYKKLKNADLSGLDLTNINFSHTDLRGASFEGSTLTDGRFYQCKLDDADFSNTILEATSFNRSNAPRANFANAQISKIDMQNESDRLNSAATGVFTVGFWRDSYFGGANFKGAKLDKTEIRTCTFEGADFEGAVFNGVNFTNCNFKNANLSHINSNLETSFGSFGNSDLIGANLSHSVFKNQHMVHTNLKDADLTNTKFLGFEAMGSANFKRAILRNTVFETDAFSPYQFKEAIFDQTVLVEHLKNDFKANKIDISQIIFVKTKDPHSHQAKEYYKLQEKALKKERSIIKRLFK